MKVLFITLAIVILDQASKIIVKGFSLSFFDFHHKGMHHGQKIQVIGDFFRLTFVENPGMAFGFDPGLGYKSLISIFSIIASAALLLYIYYSRKQVLSLRIALAFILGGAVGNLIDRIFYGVLYNYAPLFYGKVVDFLDFDFFDVTLFGRSYDRWPVFNFADSAVTIGIIILLFFYRKGSSEEKTPAAESGSQEMLNSDEQSSESGIKEL
ncbi:MAG: signal peptidase II [Ignavibacteria bacterium]